MRAVYAVLELVYPRKCVLCRRILRKEETDLCRKCRRSAPVFQAGRPGPAHTAAMTAVWYYEDAVRESLLRYKFSNARSYAGAYGRMLAMRILQDLPQADLVTWVPVSARRRRQRGYDQVELIAKAVSRETGLPCQRLIEKFRHNRAQSGLETAAQRRANVLGVYRPVRGRDLNGKRILLLDDILTTGATASECARVLLTAGAEEVIFAAVAAGRNQNE